MICRYRPPNGCGTEAPATFGHLVADLILGQIAQTRFAEALPADRDQADRQAGRIEL
jgi:hypothetical protein